jgi:tRNA uridine 5-carboxymethylaminomethyl modification enzyme
VIHRRMLNRSKGPAVQGPRVQADRDLYRTAMGELIGESGVDVIVAEALAMCVESGRVTGLETSGGLLECRALVIATGTFLNARIFVGDQVRRGGRHGERASLRLGDQVREIGLAQGRLKTGTPPRLDGRTIDWARLEAQPSDSDDWTMSALEIGVLVPSSPARSLGRTMARTRSFAPTSPGRHCSPGPLRVGGRAIARRSKTR